MKQSVPAWISRLAVAVGIALFGVTLLYIDRGATLREARQLGLLLPLVLLPSAAWHLLRTLGWLWCFPAAVRPTFVRLFRVRLAADAVSYFTVRGLASEPLRVVLLLDHVPAPMSTAAALLERTAMGVMSIILVAACAIVAISSDVLPEDWQQCTGAPAGAGPRAASHASFVRSSGFFWRSHETTRAVFAASCYWRLCASR